jgi:hypothetical protein
MFEFNEIELYKRKRNSKEFNLFLLSLAPFKIEFAEDDDNGIFTRNGVSYRFAKKILYRSSGIARTWKTAKNSKTIYKGKTFEEEFIPMTDEEFFSRYIKTIVFKLFKIEI